MVYSKATMSVHQLHAVTRDCMAVLACRLHVRVLIPCYREPLEVVSATVQAALSAELPAHVRR
jgi:hypothetical protein